MKYGTNVDEKGEESRNDQKKTRQQATVTEIILKILDILHRNRPTKWFRGWTSWAQMVQAPGMGGHKKTPHLEMTRVH